MFGLSNSKSEVSISFKKIFFKLFSGLPHCHFLVTLASGDKLKTAAQIDRAIWAVVPDRKQYARLFEVISRNNIHGPCNDRCMKDGRCRRGFPKEFRDETQADVDGYPLYRRPENGPVIEFPGKNNSLNASASFK
jgi:hypothetical protein